MYFRYNRYLIYFGDFIGGFIDICCQRALLKCLLALLLIKNEVFNKIMIFGFQPSLISNLEPSSEQSVCLKLDMEYLRGTSELAQFA